MSKPLKENRFRMRSPSYAHWTDTDNCKPKTWEEALRFINALSPAKVAGFKFQVNFVREPKP